MFTRASCLLLTVLLLSSCSDGKTYDNDSNLTVAPVSESSILTSVGTWIKDREGKIMLDPQTSGLINVNGQLVTIADGSAVEMQQRKLHTITPSNAELVASSNVFSMASRVSRSCFSSYLKNAPDFEALATDPFDNTVFYTVTEDATRTGALSPRCEKAYENTGSTDYPTLLVRLKLGEDGNISMTHVRPLQFPLSLNVGNFPNDGIEGMAMASDGTLYLGLEKDTAGQPRIFTVNLSETFWDSNDFAVVESPELKLPTFSQGSHPINGLVLYTPTDASSYLLAAARNDNELWIIDTTGKKEAKRIALSFEVEAQDGCAAYVMDNASIEGLAIIDTTLWLINDPWKKNYLKNITCEQQSAYYEASAPLLFSLPLNEQWFN
jgi:hypothetical protein